MPHRPHIKSFGMAHILSARAHRVVGIIRSRFPRDIRSRSIMPSPSGQSMAASSPREPYGVGEREFRSTRVDHHPSGESGSASFPREHVGDPERERRSGPIAARPFRESASTYAGSGDRHRVFPQSASMIYSGTTSRIVQPATSGGVCGDHRNLNPHPESIFPRGW